MKLSAWQQQGSKKVKGKKPPQTDLPLSDRLVGETLADLRSTLAVVSDQPLLEALLILSFATRLPKTWVLAHPASVLTAAQAETIDQLVEKRSQGEALPYLIGRWEFYGLEFHITPQVLIPRPETEILVEIALEWLRVHPDCRTTLDVGTGSGCIGITLASNSEQLKVIAGDISYAALRVARANAERLEVLDRVMFYQGNLTQPLAGPFDLICANLPYIPTGTLAELDVSKREPILALEGGLDGLDYIRQLLADVHRIAAPHSLLLLEIEARQGIAATAVARHYFPGAEISIHPDLAGLDRVLEIQLP